METGDYQPSHSPVLQKTKLTYKDTIHGTGTEKAVATGSIITERNFSLSAMTYRLCIFR